VETLQRLYPGSTEILLDLREALQILPRDRKRSDAYKALQVWLGENLGINLVIKSQKRK
jgi:aromatic ring-cleaving dioxygenase